MDETLTLTVYPGADGNAFLYQDDGETFDFRTGAYTRIEMKWSETSRRLDLRLATGSRMLNPDGMPMWIRLAGSDAKKQLTFHGHDVSITL